MDRVQRNYSTGASNAYQLVDGKLKVGNRKYTFVFKKEVKDEQTIKETAVAKLNESGTTPSELKVLSRQNVSTLPEEMNPLANQFTHAMMNVIGQKNVSIEEELSFFEKVCNFFEWVFSGMVNSQISELEKSLDKEFGSLDFLRTYFKNERPGVGCKSGLNRNSPYALKD